jgi:Mitochondrial K+-H+ exchange-related
MADAPAPLEPAHAPALKCLDVYLVPIARDRYECYYEAEETEDPVDPGEKGFFARMRHRFNEQLKEAEQARHQKAIEEPKTFLGRMHKRTLRWIAERMAEQRLLWHLRTADSATLHASADLLPKDAEWLMRESMKRDADFHRNRLIPHTLLLVLSAAVAVIPGPNILGYLFTFTVVGHFLAWRGAVNALHGVAWTVTTNPALTDLRHAFSLDADQRHRLIKEVATRLHMPKMARFVEQMAMSS